jgi:hypothetical protein
VATTEASARSARRRCSRKPGKYDPALSFGIASAIVPARVSHPGAGTHCGSSPALG